MGRTNATYRNHLDSFIQSFRPFRKALRQQNQRHLDSLWEKAHRYASAASYMNSSDPGVPAMVSVMVGLQKDIDRLEKRLEQMEEEI